MILVIVLMFGSAVFWIRYNDSQNFAPNWSTPVLMSTGGIYSLGCAAPDWCAAATDDGIGGTKIWNGTKWKTVSRSWTKSLNGSTYVDITAISCPKMDYCVAAVIEAIRWVRSWRLKKYIILLRGGTWIVRNELGSDPNETVTAISCPTEKFCMATTTYGVLRWDGLTWQLTNLSTGSQGLISISCSAVNFCLANAQENYYVWNGQKWSTHEVQPSGSHIAGPISCSSASFCAGGDGSAIRMWNGRSWSLPVDTDPTAMGLDAISCPTAKFCTAIDVNGEVLSWNGTEWSSPKSIRFGSGYGPFELSCPTNLFCMADGDSSGYSSDFTGQAPRGGANHR
jgi:hypothetical protein